MERFSVWKELPQFSVLTCVCAGCVYPSSNSPFSFSNWSVTRPDLLGKISHFLLTQREKADLFKIIVIR